MDAPEATPAEAERHPTLYFPDGDVVLALQRSNAADLLFRVDKIFLARHSPIFRDMLSFSAENGPNDTYDGVPLVNLVDNGEDLKTLLSGMYNAA